MSKYEVNEKSSHEMKFSDVQRSEPPTDQSFWTFLWNAKTGEFLGRTGLSWFKITVFYIIYYICLGLFFFTCYKVFESTTISFSTPRWTQDDGLIGSNPGVGFRPMPDQEIVESTLIWMNRQNELTESRWANELDKLMKDYTTTNHSQECGFHTNTQATKDKFCLVNVEKMEGCNSGPNTKYGYTQGASQPCVLIKLNKIYGWTPEPYKTLEDLEIADRRKMPAELQETIKKLIEAPPTDILKKRQLETVWVSCEGENPGDKENIGPITFHAPGIGISDFPGIPSFYYPYLNQPGYQAPFVFVKFNQPRPNVLIQVECKAWALNIIADRQARRGSVHFEIIMD